MMIIWDDPIAFVSPAVLSVYEPVVVNPVYQSVSLLVRVRKTIADMVVTVRGTLSLDMRS